LSPGTKSKIGLIFSSTPLRSASWRPSGSGIHVPVKYYQPPTTLPLFIVPTLVFAVASLHLLVHTLLYLALQNTGPARLVVVGDLEDVGSVDPVVGAAAHDVVAIDVAFVDGDYIT
jgi:hypothetical protein